MTLYEKVCVFQGMGVNKRPLLRPVIRTIAAGASLLLLLLSIGVPNIAFAITYYVDATLGSDSPHNPGTSIDSPWKTISRVNRCQSQPGDKILFKRGEIWHEELKIFKSGEPGNPLTIGAYGSGERPIFDGTYPGSIQWEDLGGGIYRTTSPSWDTEPGVLIYNGAPKPPITTLLFRDLVPAPLNVDAILIQCKVDQNGTCTSAVYTNLLVTSKKGDSVSGITFFEIDADKAQTVIVRQINADGVEEQWPQSERLYLEDVTTSMDGLTLPGHWYWDEQSKSIYLYSDHAPGDDVGIGDLNVGINSQGRDYLVIEDIILRGYNSSGLWLNYSTGSVVQNLLVYGTGATGHKTGLLLSNSNDNVIRKNRVDSVLRSGIGLYARPPADGTTITSNNSIIDNIVLNSGSTGITLNTDGKVGIIAQNLSDNRIENNRVLNSNTMSYDSAGVYTLWIGKGNIIRGNSIRDGGSTVLRSAGIMIDGGVIHIGGQPNSVGIYDNTIINNSLGGVVLSGAGHVVQGNTLSCNGVSSWESGQLLFFPSFGSNAESCSVHDNLMGADSNQKLVTVLNGMPGSSPPHEIDSNTYRSVRSESFCWGRNECEELLGMSAWQIESGLDYNSAFNRVDYSFLGCDQGASTPATPVSGNSVHLRGVYGLLFD
ncbi:MAG: right-handed parallel beta-helix repeat-containing protein [Thermodesulfobacteriota bacterium]|nr:right-handed parallel beta-helix repeat-containing protein [Thermodesulfobacteriota bacterium]